MSSQHSAVSGQQAPGGTQVSAAIRRGFLFFGLLLSTLSPQLSAALAAPTHPRLMLTPADVQNIRANLGKAPFFDAELASAKARVGKAIAAPIVVPVPADAAGFTHERHKANYTEMYLAGFLYQVTGEARYA